MSITGPLKTSIQLLRGGEPAIGPGKAMVLDAIERTGSISAAGRDLGMSYRRIWLLVESLNADWCEPVVRTDRWRHEARSEPDRLRSRTAGALQEAGKRYGGGCRG